MARFMRLNKDGSMSLEKVDIGPRIYSEAEKAGLSVEQFVNRTYPTETAKYGTAFDQMLASVNLLVPDANLQREMGYRAPTMLDVLNGSAQIDVAAGTSGVGSPTGSESRTLFPAALIAYMESALVKDYTTDADLFDKMVAQTISVATDRFEQPIINMSGRPSGPQAARAQRRAQLAPPAAMMSFTTSDTTRKIPTFALGMEFSKEALRATTLDIVGLAVRRQLAVERDSWVYSNLSDLYGGDLDINTSSLSTLGYNIATVTLDSAGASGTITQKAWLGWLFRSRKTRKIDWVVCDLATYLRIEGRTGRPSLTAIDQLLPRMEAQAVVQNPGIGDVNVMIVDDAANGGPIPANTVMGVDSRYGIVRVRNTSADVTAAETFALRQAEAFSIQFGEMCYRMYPEAFDTLTIS